AAATLANQRADIPHNTRTLLSRQLEADSMNKAEITMIKDIIETQESWFFTFEASMGELRSQLRRLESSLVETMGQRLSSLERTTDEHTQRLLSLETALREWSSRLLSLQSMAEAWSNDLLDVRNVVQHESTTRIQQIDQVNKAQEDVRKTGERMLY